MSNGRIDTHCLDFRLDLRYFLFISRISHPDIAADIAHSLFFIKISGLIIQHADKLCNSAQKTIYAVRKHIL